MSESDISGTGTFPVMSQSLPISSEGPAANSSTNSMNKDTCNESSTLPDNSHCLTSNTQQNLTDALPLAPAIVPKKPFLVRMYNRALALHKENTGLVVYFTFTFKIHNYEIYF